LNLVLGVSILVAAAGAGWLLWHSWVRPLFEIRETISAMAAREDRRPIIRSSLRPFTEIAGDLGRISDLLHDQGRQLSDEGFSLRAILGSMVEGIMIVDSSLRIRLANDALHTMFDLKRSPINRTVFEVFRDPALAPAIDRSIAEIRPVNLEFQTDSLMSAGRPQRHFRVNLAPLFPSGGAIPAGVLAVFDDLTEVRTLETVRREFVANVSHEFRTPLAIINGYVETLLEGALDDREMSERALGVMQKHCKRLNLLIDDLLTISKLEHRSRAMQFRSINLREILQRVIDQLEPQIAGRGATVGVEFDPEAEVAEADPSQIEQVFFNFVSNALQYGPKDGVDVNVTGRRRGEEIEVSFSDNGPGIPYEDQPHIFERFYRVHKDRSRDAGGTGLGLSIVKNVALAHDGHVSVRSTPGSGAIFKFVLPVRHLPADGRAA